jgi:hypothetical protein
LTSDLLECARAPRRVQRKTHCEQGPR